MTDFYEQYTQLNNEQKRAVDLIDGPLLVLAGPGTGKTQLLSARVANILDKTDTLPQNIVCLTFTEMATHNMRQRLMGMIGEAAYDVHISTYHSFGSDIIRSYPEYFVELNLETGEDSRLERPIDDLTKTQILNDLIQKLAYDDPLRSAKYYINSVDSTISDIKKSNISPDTLRELADQNLRSVHELSPKINEIIGTMQRIGSFKQAYPLFEALREVFKGNSSQLSSQALQDLEQALQQAEASNKTTTLTAWKNKWLTKDDANAWVFTNEEQHLKLVSLARIYERYQETLKSRSIYDFDDMILRTIDALKTNDELRNNVQEKYQYILLDEFQDTNAAQFDMVNLIANHPVHEGRPNIMAVGDDDQAIYAFQGAEVSNMVRFVESYRDTAVINLKKNYRSHHDIINVAHNISEQIETRLHTQLDNIEKDLEAAQTNLPAKATIERHEFQAQASEYAWIASKINDLIASGVKPEEIALLSPKHALLEEVVPCLNKYNIPVTYEKRENILNTPIVQQLQLMAQLLEAIMQNNQKAMSHIFPQVLSLHFWNIPVETIWKINWQAAKFEESRSWAEIALEDATLKDTVLFFLGLGSQAEHMPLEYVLDILTGTQSFELHAENSYTSPFKSYYFASSKQESLAYFEAITYLSIIRSHLRTYQQSENTLLTIRDFLRFFEMYADADKPLINSHPIAQDSSSVQLMTVYKAKGLEYEYVFLLSLQDDIWGKTARSNSNKIPLPANISHIRYRGSSEDELRRLLFVAVTRAKHGLFLTSFAFKDTGKQTEPVKYLLETQNEAGERQTTILPESTQTVIKTDFEPHESYTHIETLWQQRHITFETSLKSLLQERLQRYQMSPTHLNSFIDLEYSGPQEFLLRTLLRFPAAPTIDGEYGNAIHQSLEWYQNHIESANLTTLLEYYTKLIDNCYIPDETKDDMRARGRKALSAYIAARRSMFTEHALSEVDFRKEGVLLGTAHLTGKIDRLEIDTKTKKLRIIDYKTGKPYPGWKKDLKLHRYEQQLYFYMLLIEKSHTYKEYTIEHARLEFIEPSSNGTIVAPLILNFNEKKYAEFKHLIEAVWDKIQNVDMPDTSIYQPNLNGVLEFQKDLLIDTKSE